MRAHDSFREIGDVLGQPAGTVRRVSGDVRTVGTVLQKPSTRQGIPQEMIPVLRALEVCADSRSEWSP